MQRDAVRELLAPARQPAFALPPDTIDAELADADQKSSGNKGIAITNDGERHMRSIGPINRPADIERLNNGPKATRDRATYDKLQALK
jgi:hypothetical protein